MTTTYPEHISDVLLSLHQGLEETLVGWNDAEKHKDLHQLESITAAYVDALGHIVGAPQGSLHPIDLDILKA